MSENANRLIHATSPYLLQHAHNPVDWHEWGTEALDKAKAEDKPILVSIGYSSCHWCHVMERACFENHDLADLMNEFFVCIKIDREERPDLDQLYMEAVQAMGVNGGWPLNVFLTPDQRPFYGGTYFQPQAWAQVLRGLHEAYRNRRSDVNASAASLAEALAASDIDRFVQRANPMALRDEAQAVYEKLSAGFDAAWGGMDKAPKFVMPSVWMLIMRYHYLTRDTHARDHLLFTLRKMAMGGIYDQVGGGFARYAVDREWFAPHFEKMLYDTPNCSLCM
ncbi:MAG: thioredoxin domain-containing protein, partial [Bacteroidia bacterium]|nr:thioredoxin domain-containing protein [Bacteroidia bacterium]